MNLVLRPTFTTWSTRLGIVLGATSAAAYVANGATALPCAPGATGNLVDLPAGIVGAVMIAGVTAALWLVQRKTKSSALKAGAAVAFAGLAFVFLMLTIGHIDDVVRNVSGTHTYSSTCGT